MMILLLALSILLLPMTVLFRWRKAAQQEWPEKRKPSPGDPAHHASCLKCKHERKWSLEVYNFAIYHRVSRTQDSLACTRVAGPASPFDFRGRRRFLNLLPMLQGQYDRVAQDTVRFRVRRPSLYQFTKQDRT
jgi:hypothetical protein